MGALPTYKTPPRVIVTRPKPSEDDVSRETVITATFDMPMYPSSISADQFVVSGQGGGRGGSVAYDPLTKTATFTPDAPFNPGETISVRLTNSILSLWGLAMEADYTWTFHVTAGTDVAIGDPVSLPESFALHQNYPNPFNAETRIRFNLPTSGRAGLRIYNVTGAVVRTLVDVDLPAGEHLAAWNGCDGNGRPLSSGVYFCRLVAGDRSDVRKMILMR
jgi:hypothetical protein